MARGHFRNGRRSCFDCGKRPEEAEIRGIRGVYGPHDTTLTHLCERCARAHGCAWTPKARGVVGKRAGVQG